MQTSVETIASTVEEAIQQGLEALGASPDQVEIEVLDSGSKGFLGFGSRQVRVRLRLITAPEAQLQPEAPSTADQPSEAPAEVPVASSEGAEAGFDLALRTRQVLEEILRLLHIEGATVNVRSVEQQEAHHIVQVDIQGKNLNLLIGRRAETLQALQHIVSLIIGKEMEAWVHVVIDVEGYRQRRERQLRQLAKRMAEQAVRTGRRQVLEPMSAADRRIIHLELRDHPDVTTQSIGEEPNRKVTIIPRR
ncbi:MAG: RNA-binding cell elongation regulator Jag/EloR [Anaerolineales bacterium]